MDLMVKNTQIWLNKTYKNDSRYKVIKEDGATGWTTIYALTRALQIELGITSTADSFGVTTQSKFISKYPNGIAQQAEGATAESNIYAIIQGALWCKGYGTGSGVITKHFYSGTGTAIKKLKSDAGLTNPNSTVTLHVMEALLSMNQYVLLSNLGGSTIIRTIQQGLNRECEAYIGLCPCDGIYGREMNKALIKALQAVEGLSPSEATGSFGPTTKTKCPILPDGSNVSAANKEKAIMLLKCALACNGYTNSLWATGWNSQLESEVKKYQKDMALNQTGKGDLDTWMSLLLSSGNPDRAAIACDTRFEITQARAEQLVSKGYKIVGRYLTGSDFKVIRKLELPTILYNGLNFFPIFQESTTDITYFTYDRGLRDAKKAVKAAIDFGIGDGNVIYFAVDLDAQDSNIKNYILPYFKGIAENIDKKFLVGVYGTRNVCQQVSNVGYAVASFVSDMSTGYSGNMGYKIPSNWNFDQFDEIGMGADWGIDKVAYSGKYAPVSKLAPIYTQPEKPSTANKTSIFGIMSLIKKIEEFYYEYYTTNMGSPNTETMCLGVLNYLMSQAYKDFEWQLSTGYAIDKKFVAFVEAKGSYAAAIDSYIDKEKREEISDGGTGMLDLPHLAASIEGYLASTAVPSFWTGWGGDLATGMADTTAALPKTYDDKTLLNKAFEIIGGQGHCNYSDFCCDMDAIKIADLINNYNGSFTKNVFTSILENYYTNYCNNRFSFILTDLGCKEDFTELYMAVVAKMNGGLESAPIKGLLALKGNNPSQPVNSACCQAFAHYCYNEIYKLKY